MFSPRHLNFLRENLPITPSALGGSHGRRTFCAPFLPGRLQWFFPLVLEKPINADELTSMVKRLTDIETLSC
jgi:hypothetical protein